MPSLYLNFFQLLNSTDSEPLSPNVEPQKSLSSIFGPVVPNGYSNSSYINYTSFDQLTTTINGIIIIRFFFMYTKFIINDLDILATMNTMNFSVDKENESPVLNNDLSSSSQVSGKFNLSLSIYM